MHKIHVLTKIYENKIENEIKNSSFFVCMFFTFPANSNKKPKQKKTPKETGTAVWAPQRAGCMEAD